VVTLQQSFIVALMGMHQHSRGQVLGVGGTKYIFRGEIFLFHFKFETNCDMTNSSVKVPVVQIYFVTLRLGNVRWCCEFAQQLNILKLSIAKIC